MGAATFTRIGYGANVREAYNNLCEDAREEYGHQQGYSGEIHDTHLNKNITDKYKAAKNKDDFEEEWLSNMGKRDTDYVVLKEPKTNTNKIKSTVERNPQKGARTWETRYIVYDPRTDSEVYSETNQAEAIRKGRAYCEKHQRRVHIEIAKKLTAGNGMVASISFKQSDTNAQGKYLFLVCAPD